MTGESRDVLSEHFNNKLAYRHFNPARNIKLLLPGVGGVVVVVGGGGGGGYCVIQDQEIRPKLILNSNFMRS